MTRISLLRRQISLPIREIRVIRGKILLLLIFDFQNCSGAL